MFYLNRTLKNELNEYYKKLTYIENEINTNKILTKKIIEEIEYKINYLERVIREYINKNDEKIKQIKNTTNTDNKYISKKQNEQSKINEEIAKKYKMLLNGLNETRLAIQTIAKILKENNTLKLKEENNDARKTSDKRK